MDNNDLIEILKNGAPSIQSNVSLVVSAVITRLFLKKNTDTTELAKIKSGLFKEVVTDLLDNGKMTYYEFYKCNNFLKIAKLADEMKSEFTQENGNKEYDFDWFIRFFDAVSTISNENMQGLWAKILNGEIQQHGSFSFRAIETMRNLSQYEAELFAMVSSIVLDNAIIFSSMEGIGQEINERYGFDNDALRLLEECGLINGLKMENELFLDPNEASGFELDGKLLLFTNTGNERIALNYTCYNLTRVGIELFPVVYMSNDNNPYLQDLGRAINDKYEKLKVSIHPIDYIDDELDSVSYDANVDLFKYL